MRNDNICKKTKYFIEGVASIGKAWNIFSI